MRGNKLVVGNFMRGEPGEWLKKGEEIRFVNVVGGNYCQTRSKGASKRSRHLVRFAPPEFNRVFLDVASSRSPPTAFEA